MGQLGQCEPIYESMPGWSTPTKGIRRYEDLPENARNYVARLEVVSGVPAALISTGSERSDTILRDDVLRDKLPRRSGCRSPSEDQQSARGHT